MRQSTVIFGAILFAFVVYITMRGQLDDYIDLFKSKPKASASSSSGSNVLGDAGNAISDVLGKAKDMLGVGKVLGGIF